MIVGLIINAAICWWVYADAAKKGSSNKVLWTVLTFIFGFIALGIYLIRTGRKGWGTFFIILWAILILVILLGLVAAIGLVLKQGG